MLCFLINTFCSKPSKRSSGLSGLFFSFSRLFIGRFWVCLFVFKIYYFLLPLAFWGWRSKTQFLFGGISWLVFANMIQTTVAWEEEPSMEELLLSSWPVGMSVREPFWHPGSPELMVGSNQKICSMVQEAKAQVGISTENWGPVPTPWPLLSSWQKARYTRALFIPFSSCPLMVPSAFWKLNSEVQASNYLTEFAGMHFIIKAMAICP